MASTSAGMGITSALTGANTWAIVRPGDDKLKVSNPILEEIKKRKAAAKVLEDQKRKETELTRVVGVNGSKRGQL